MSETIRKITGWLMMLLGVLILIGALADSRAGGWVGTGAPAVTTASLAGINRVHIRVDEAHVRVVAEERADLAVTLEGKNSDAVDLELARHGSEQQVRIWAPWWRFPGPVAVIIRLPQTFAETLSLDVRTGRVEVQGLRVDKLDLRLVTGKVDLTRFTGALQAEITTGSVEAQFDALTGPVTVNQVQGRLVLDLPAAGDFTVDARAARGRVQNDLPRVGAGTHAVTLRVQTGEITIR